MTLCPQLMDALNSAFSRKYHSMAQYILEARPYVPAGRDGALEAIRAAATEDQQFADRLAAVIEEVEGVPQLEIFNPEVASLNYLALDYLLNYLIKDLQEQLAEVERALAQVNGADSVRRVLTDLADTTQKQLERLQAASAA